MKYFLLLASCFLSLTSCEHTKHMYKKNKFPVPFEYSISDSGHGTDAEQYEKAYKWLKKKTTLDSFTIDSANKQSGTIKAKGTLQFKTRKILVMVNREIITYQVTIKINDGKSTCTFSDFNHKSNGVKNGNSYKNEKPKYFDYSLGNLTQADPKSADKRRWDKIKDETQKETKKILRGFKNAEMR